jgi:cation:H+ antiporter
VANSIILVVLGLGILAFGGEILVRGSVAVARGAGLTPAVIGLTVVAAGTSLPELVVSLLAALNGQPDIAVGNVVGSNIFNIGLIVGLVAVVADVPIRGNVIKLEYPVMLLATVSFLLLAADGVFDGYEAAVFLLALVLFTGWSVHIAREDVAPVEVAQLEAEVKWRVLHPRHQAMLLSVLAVLAGLGLLALGGRVLVDGAVKLAQLAGLSERVIGLTIVAAGTSAPEIAASLVAARRGHTDLAVGNLIGSNIFNLLGILGVSALIVPLRIAPGIVQQDGWWMLGITALLFPLMLVGRKLSRLDGLMLLTAYGLYLFLLLRPEGGLAIGIHR